MVTRKRSRPVTACLRYWDSWGCIRCLEFCFYFSSAAKSNGDQRLIFYPHTSATRSTAIAVIVGRRYIAREPHSIRRKGDHGEGRSLAVPFRSEISSGFSPRGCGPRGHYGNCLVHDRCGDGGGLRRA